MLGAMLTDDDKQRIRDEEAFRHEVRRQLEAASPPRSRKERLWGILNSAFVMWVFSSVVLGVFGWGYANYQAYVHRQELKRRLHTELASRAIEALLALEAVRAQLSKSPPSPEKIYDIVRDQLDGIDTTRDARMLSTHPDYKERGFRSLVVELGSLVGSHDQKRLAQVRESHFMLRTTMTPAADSVVALKNAQAILHGIAVQLSTVAGEPPPTPPATPSG
jgi:hypothetical protein